MSDRYVVLADVVDSRDVSDRDSLGDALSTALERVNATHGESIATPFERIKGVDEFGGVLAALAPVYEVIAAVLNDVHPVRARFAIAGGQVDVSAGADSVSAMDGPAFHRADRLLDEAESADLYAAVDAGRPTDPLVASTLNLLLMRRERLTERQVEVVRAYERHGTQAAAADALDVRQQSVSKTLARADYSRTRRIRTTLRDALEGIYGS